MVESLPSQCNRPSHLTAPIMPAPSDPNNLGIDPGLLDRQQANFSAIDLDVPLNNSSSGSSNPPAPSPPNQQPIWGFNPLQPRYSAGDTFTLEGWIEDFDGIADLDRIDLTLDVSGRPLNLGQITQFVSDPHNPNAATFSYDIALKDLAIAEGYHYIGIEGIAYDRAGKGTLNYTSFELTNHRPNFSFYSSKQVYDASETITFDSAWVEDMDGLEDLSHINFQLRRMSGGDEIVIDLPDVTTFNPDYPGSFRGTFDYNIDLRALDIPEGQSDWAIEGYLVDKAGNNSRIEGQTFFLRNNSPNLQFDFSDPYYSVGDTLTFDYASVDDPDGIETLDRINFKLIITDRNSYQLDREIDLPDVTEFIPDYPGASHGTFAYNLDFKNANLPIGSHQVRLEGILYDRSGNTSDVITRNFQLNIPYPNINFDLVDPGHYSANDVLAFRNTWIDGIDNLERINFRVISGETIIDVADVTEFVPDFGGSSSGTFTYNLDLKTLDLAPGLSHDVNLDAIVHTKSGQVYVDRWSRKNFIVSHFLPDTPIFSLDRTSYNASETLRITGGSVSDRDGASDLTHIDFRIRTADGSYIDLPDVTSLNIANPHDLQAYFDYSVDLSTLPIDRGTYTFYLEAIAYDFLGNGSLEASQQFQLTKDSGVANSNIPALGFYLNSGNFVAGDTVTLENAWVKDSNGIADIDRIDFFLRRDSGHIIDLADVTQFTAIQSDPYLATFNYSFKIENLGAYDYRNYSLVGIAYDESGQGSQRQEWNFNAISDGLPSLNFHIDNREYGVGETLTLQDVWVEDPNGIADIDRIDFYVFVKNSLADSYSIDLLDVVEFTSDYPGASRGTFNYSVDLWKLGVEHEDYYRVVGHDVELVGFIYDKDGNQRGYSQNFHLNTWVPDFTYEIEGWQNNTYTVGDTLTLKNTIVLGVKNIGDIDRIDFWAIVDGNIQIDMPDVTEFNLLQGGYEANFDYSYNLADLGLGFGYHNVEIRSALYNRAGHSKLHWRSHSLQVTNNAPRFGFFTDGANNYFAAGDTLSLRNTWVEDFDGIDNIDRIDFTATVNGNEFIDLPDVTQFIIDEGNPYRGSFEYAFDLKLLGIDINTSANVILDATIFDKAGNTAFHWQQFNLSNYRPNFDFNIDRSQYGFNDTLVIDGWVEDSGGIAEFDRIDLRLRMGNNWYNYIDIADITSITPDPNQFNRGMFSQEISLASLGLPLGNHDLYLEAIAYDKAGNGVRGMEKSFRVTNNVPYFDFTLPQGEYRPDDTISITQGWVEDIDGFNDIDRVDFSLRNLSNGELIDVADVVDFTADPGNTTQGSYAYSLYLGSFDLQPGHYDLEGIVIDKQGNSSPLVKKGFAIAQPDHAPQDLRFRLDKSEYTSTETVLLNHGWIMDADGAADLTRVDLRLLDANDNVVADINPVTDLEPMSWNPLWAGFNTQINLNGLNLSDGIYTISAIAYDLTNQTSNVFERSFGVKSPPPNFAPSNLTFSLDRTTYQPTDTINLGNGWVRDENGADTLDRINLRIVTEQGNTLDLDDITNLSPASWNQAWASFQYGASLAGLNLQKGSHKLVGIAYDREGAASSQFERDFYLDVPQVNLNPTDLRFTLDQTTYNSTDTLEIGNGWISDGDGSDDLENVSFKLVASNGNEIDLGAIANFTYASWSPDWASFSGSFDLSQYNLTDGTYTLMGVATDKSGGQSQTLSRAFTIETPQTNNTAPAGLQFGLHGSTFSTADTLQITNGWVYDEDGNSDLVGVDFELVAEDGTAIDLTDSFDLTAATWDWSNQWSSFRHNLNLSNLGLSTGNYSLRGKAYDRAGDYSNIFSRSFTLV